MVETLFYQWCGQVEKEIRNNEFEAPTSNDATYAILRPDYTSYRAIEYCALICAEVNAIRTTVSPHMIKSDVLEVNNSHLFIYFATPKRTLK
jgi:hypothetical protein